MKFVKIKKISPLRTDNVFDVHHFLTDDHFQDHHPNLIVNNVVISNCGRHAGGVIIGEDLQRNAPLIRSKDVIQFPFAEGQNVRHCEPMGFIKFDLLGIATLEMMEDAISLILKRHFNVQKPTFQDIKDFYHQHLHPDVIDFDDQKVYEETFHIGKYCGTFQFDQDGMRGFATKAMPRSLIDLSAITSAYRPGPMDANVPEDYLLIKEDPTKIEYIHPIVKQFTEKTYGFLIFQEQIAQIACALGKDVSEDEGNLLRKVLTKKGTGKEAEVKEKIKGKFIDGCLEKGLTKEKAEHQWQTFINFAGYGFNKCISGEMEVETKQGNKKIRNVKVGEFVKSKHGFVKVLDKIKNGRKKVVRVKTSSGKVLVATVDHKVETLEGMKTLDEVIKRNMKIICAKE